jgi:hypothetical protein
MSSILTPLTLGGITAITAASGGAAVINDATSVTLSIFIGGIVTLSAIGVWLGTKAVQLAIRLEQGNGRMDRLETRLTTVEKALDRLVK